MRVLVTGDRGLIGGALVKLLRARGDDVVGLGRDRGRTPWWDVDAGHVEGSLEGFDAVVHLAGENIGARRWTDEQKQRIHDSRIRSTELLARTLAGCERKPS